MDYYEKYIKYKTKYIYLKNAQKGGNDLDNVILKIYKKNTRTPKEVIKDISWDYIKEFYKNKKINEDTTTITIHYNKKINELKAITNYFILPARMKCKLETSKYSPYDLFIEEYKKNSDMNKYDIKRIMKNNNCTLLDFTRIMYLLNTFYPNKNDIKYLDCCAGWGDRLLASLLYGVSEYRGYDPNLNLQNGHNELKNYIFNNKLAGYYGKNKMLKKKNFKIVYDPFEINYADENMLLNHYDICISSPPFFIFEIYSDKETQSTATNDTVEKWLSNFIYPSFKKILTMLKSKGYICWYLEDKPEYNFMDEFINFTKSLDCKYIGKTGFVYDDAIEIRYFNIWQKN